MKLFKWNTSSERENLISRCTSSHRLVDLSSDFLVVVVIAIAVAVLHIIIIFDCQLRIVNMWIVDNNSDMEFQKR